MREGEVRWWWWWGGAGTASSPWHFSTTEPPPFCVVALCQGVTAVADVDFLSPLSTTATETANYALISKSQPQHWSPPCPFPSLPPSPPRHATTSGRRAPGVTQKQRPHLCRLATVPFAGMKHGVEGLAEEKAIYRGRRNVQYERVVTHSHAQWVDVRLAKMCVWVPLNLPNLI